MSFLRNLLDIRDIKGPEFYKDFESENKQLYELEELHSKVKSEKRNVIKRDITYLKIGLEGERAVSYELKNSFIPMICLHDIRIENAGYIAQMDYILITEYYIMVLETKKLNGDIVINEAGEFIRKFKTKEGRVYKQEGMYSPISQNERHIRILDNFLKANKIIRRIPMYSAVVVANPKAIINRNKAPYAIKNGIYKHDQITTILKKHILKSNKDEKIMESQMIKIANFLLESNKEISYDYNAKYGLTDEDFTELKNSEEVEGHNVLEEEVIEYNAIEEKVIKEIHIEDKEAKEGKEGKDVIEEVIKDIESELNADDQKEKEIVKEVDQDKELYEVMRQYRYTKAKEEGNKPYFIFSNKTLESLVEVKPRSKSELIKIQGFGPVKVDTYGDDIVGIIQSWSNESS